MKNKGIMQKPGVYKITNNISGKIYIGSSVNVYRRFYRHKQVLREGIRDNLRIKDDFDKYGIDSFDFEVIEYCGKEGLKDREQFYFEYFCPQYNVWKSVYDASNREYTPEQLESFKKLHRPIKDKVLFKEKLRKGWIKRKEVMTPEELREKHAEARRGIPHSEETKKMLSEMRKGKPKSEKWKENLRQRRMGTKLINGKYVKNFEVF